MGLHLLGGVLAIIEALAAASTTTVPRPAWKNSRFLGPLTIEIERAASTGGGTLYGASLLGPSNEDRNDLAGDGVATNYDTDIDYEAFSNYNWLVKVDRSPRTGTVAVTAASKTVTGTGTAFLTELRIGDEVQVNGERRTVLAIASDTSLTTDEAFVNAASGVAIALVDGLLVHTTDFTVANNGGTARITLSAAAKLPSGAKMEVHKVTPKNLFSFATATLQFKRFEIPGGNDVIWYASDATATPSATNIYASPIGQ